ncbi:hypothetical protein [uncultured Methanobrevibacter sp.]|uniref:hypothetical protein n=1 Tax=uncultured Methanobrevibacter sp. TaxID=253161 RepID=UPI0025CD3F82|nr:hypothetical protein [uncultured Methanobrevibacter sp.]
MDFNIIDGHDDFDHEAILQDYQNLDLTVREIKEKYDIGDSKWQTITRHWKEAGIPLRGRMNRKKHQYITTPFASKNYSKTTSGRYRVYKKIKGVNYYFGVFDSEEEARAKVEELRQNNWDGLL